MKKTVVILLTLTILLAMSVPVAASFADTAGKNCETAAEVLAALGIVEGKSEGMYEPESFLTRAEMATIILRTMNMTGGAAGSDIFADVPSDHWAYANIAAAYQLGIVNGTSETTFEPDASVTGEQAVKMVVAALGYTVKAEAAGGYPSGYLSIASQLDLLRGVQIGGEMTRGDMAILVYNALDAELFMQTSYGSDALTFETNEAKTLLSYYLKADCITAEITATPMGEITAPGKKLESDEVAVGTTVMKKGETDAPNMLGISADIYTREDSVTEETVILAIVPRQSTKVTDLRVSDIEIQSSEITYEDEAGIERKVSISEAQLIYNGRVETNRAYLENMVRGTVRLIANNGSCNYVIAEEYENFVVDRVYLEENTVYFKNSGAAPMVIDLAESGNILTDAEGTPLALSEVMEWDVLSVAESKDKTMRRIHSSYATVIGKVTEISEKEVHIGDKVYAVAAPLALGTIELGMTADFSLDYTGAIAAVDEASVKSNTYGWLVGAANTKGIGAQPQLKIFTEEGKMQVFGTTERVTLNGTSINRSGLLSVSSFSGVDLWSDGKETPLLDAAGQIVPQLLLYETNSAGEITMIDTAANLSDPTGTKTYGGDFSMDWYYHSPLDAYAINAETESQIVEFNGTAMGNTAKKLASRNRNLRSIYFRNVYVDPATPLFVIPYDQTREEDYEIRSQKDFGYTAAVNSRCVSFYDIDDEYKCGAMVIHTYLDKGGASDSYPGSTTAYGLVTALTNVLSEDGEVLRSLKLQTKSGEATVYFEEDDRALFGYTGSDIVKDPDWYTTDGTNDTPIAFAGGKEAYRQRVTRPGGSIMLPMYIKVNKLVPGDVIQYTADPAGKLTTASVLFRGEYPEYIEKAQGKNYGVVPTNAVATYVDGGGHLTVNGIVKELKSYGLMVETYPVNNKGEKQASPFLSALPAYGDYYLADMEKDEIKKITVGDIREGDEIFSFWSTDTQVVTVVYRNR